MKPILALALLAVLGFAVAGCGSAKKAKSGQYTVTLYKKADSSPITVRGTTTIPNVKPGARVNCKGWKGQGVAVPSRGGEALITFESQIAIPGKKTSGSVMSLTRRPKRVGHGQLQAVQVGGLAPGGFLWVAQHRDPAVTFPSPRQNPELRGPLEADSPRFLRIEIPEPMKRCGRCGGLLPLEEFTSDRDKPSGRGSYCRPCDRERAREFYARNRRRSWRVLRLGVSPRRHAAAPSAGRSSRAAGGLSARSVAARLGSSGCIRRRIRRGRRGRLSGGGSFGEAEAAERVTSGAE